MRHLRAERCSIALSKLIWIQPASKKSSCYSILYYALVTVVEPVTRCDNVSKKKVAFFHGYLSSNIFHSPKSMFCFPQIFPTSRKARRTEVSSVPVMHQLKWRIKKDCNITSQSPTKATMPGVTFRVFPVKNKEKNHTKMIVFSGFYLLSSLWF